MSNRTRDKRQLTLKLDELAVYDGVGGLTLIPLHRYDATSNKGGRVRSDAKRPRDNDWQNRPYPNAVKTLKECIEHVRNIGVRLSSAWLVIDIDPRNGGEQGFANLCVDVGLDPTGWPCVITGSGGRHYYLRMPPGFADKIMDTLDAYPGVEFKSGNGRQVVAAGSIHPDTFKHYEWELGTVALADAPEIPPRLLAYITRPARNYEATGGGQYTSEQIAKALEALDVTDFRDHDTWFALMCAVHHASAGDARQEWVEWCVSDPEYREDEDIIGRRWDSLHVERPGGLITVRTFNAILAEHGAANLQVAPEVPADEFEGCDEEPSENAWLEGGLDALSDDDGVKPENSGGYDDEAISKLEALNEKYCAVMQGGKYRIMYRTKASTGLVWEATSRRDFEDLLANNRIENPNERSIVPTIPLGRAWQQWAQRRTAFGTTLDTALRAGELDSEVRLNLWLDWGVEPKPGKWPKFESMIRNDLCGEEKKAADYFIRWLVWVFQNPADIPEVAAAFRGAKGTGKGTGGETFVRCFGSHGMATSSMEHIFGRFNGHLEPILFMFADEAFFAGDKRQEARIKKLVTDKNTTYEYKGVTSFPGVNRVSLIMATNDDWIVPASEGERRFFVARTSDAHKCPEGEPNHPNRAYSDAIHAELAAGGINAFLYDMLRFPLNGWHPRGNVPLTQELANQKAKSFEGVTAYYFERLQRGEPPDVLEGTNADWSKGPLMVKPTMFWEACLADIRYTNRHAQLTRRAVGEELRRFGWDIGEHNKRGRNGDRFWLCPPLEEARTTFETIMKGKFFD